MAIGYGKDYMKTTIGNQMIGMYYYGLDKDRFGLLDINTKIFGYVPTIQSVTYNPFLDMEDSQIEFIECEFDSEYYHFEDTPQPKVYRLGSVEVYSKLLGQFDIVSYLNSFSERFEPRMLHYPFRYFALTDYINPPLIMKFENISWDENGKVNFKARIGMSNSSKYILYSEGYKGDDIGNLEGIVNNNPLQYPVGSSAYASFMATQGNSYTTNNQLALAENDKSYTQTSQSLDLTQSQNAMGTISNMIGGLSSVLAGNIGAGVGQALGSGINGIMQTKVFNQQNQFNVQNRDFKEYSIEAQSLALKQDLFSTPRAIKTIGNDATFTVNNARKRVDLLEYVPKQMKELELDRFFKRYGVATNSYKIPNLNNRKYWNFVKCVKANIDSASIPYNDLKSIEKIFESGITLWHVDNGAVIKDYTKFNEVI